MQRKVIISLIIILLASFLYLAFIEQGQREEGNFWVLYFSDPKGENLDFVIENHSDKNNFHWEILAEKEKIKEDDIKIAKGSTWELNSQVTDYSNKKITIVVSDGESKKEIYKIFEK